MKPRVHLILPNGGRFEMETKVIPRIGDAVECEGKHWGEVESVKCVYSRANGDHYVVQLGHMKR